MLASHAFFLLPVLYQLISEITLSFAHFKNGFSWNYFFQFLIVGFEQLRFLNFGIYILIVHLFEIGFFVFIFISEKCRSVFLHYFPDCLFIFHENWEWLFLLCFFPALPKGSSGQLLDDFDPQSGSLTYMNKDQPYIFSALITLNVEDAQFSSDMGGTLRQLSYSEATDALARLIQVSPSGFGAAEVIHAE